jgi:signal peptidase I
MDDPGNGTIPENMVVGRAFLIVWPPSRWRILQIPSTFGQPGIDSSSAARAAGAAAAAGTAIAPAAPYLPLEAGFVIAVPLTLVQRWARRRRLLSGLLRHGRGLLPAWLGLGALRERLRCR